MKQKVCKICGKLFIPDSPHRQYCDDEYIRTCVICGAKFKVTSVSNKKQCCSRKCSQKLKESQWIKKYGVDNPAKSQIVKDKQAKTNIERYNSKTPFTASACLEKRKQTMISKYGTEFAMKNDILKHRQQEAVTTHLGVSSPLSLESVKQAQRDAYQDPKRSRDAAIKRSVTQKHNNIASDGTILDSSYELEVYEFCLRNNLHVERQIPIEYEYNGQSHITLIDFKIDEYLFECKGSHLLRGLYDYADNIIPIEVKLDVYKKNHVIVITDKTGSNVFGKPNSRDSNGLKYNSKCHNPLIGIDISLFRKNPNFPYRDDRPKLFYDVKVDGHKSSYEAFYDESVRWIIIKNRIEYSGGFIDNNQILTGMNVTRICKQPSWFSEELAKHIISTYCSTDIIVDPFAGWGTRDDAALKLGKKYVGGDYNKELVNWHHEQGRINIMWCDAKRFTYNEQCSVFICPPYSDPKTGKCFEDYNFEGFDSSAKSLSQCDWMKIVMKNVPNANEYILVCKIIDKGWEKFTVERIDKKSHFGLSSEYILVIPNEESKKFPE